MIRKSLKILILLCLLLVTFATAIAQQVTVSGVAPGAEGKAVKLITWSDLITFTEELVAKTVIDSVGNFTMNFELPATSYIALAIDLHRAEFYMQPDHDYKMEIEQINYKDNLEVNPFILSENL